MRCGVITVFSLLQMKKSRLKDVNELVHVNQFNKRLSW